MDKGILQDPKKTKSWLMSTPKTDKYSKKCVSEDLDFEDEIEQLRTDLNLYCCDCLEPNPDWVSVNNGIFLCIKCAGAHRSYGVDISFVRSLKLDMIDESQIEMLKMGGNRKFLEFV